MHSLVVPPQHMAPTGSPHMTAGTVLVQKQGLFVMCSSLQSTIKTLHSALD